MSEAIPFPKWDFEGPEARQQAMEKLRELND